jgi:hypothetical protein
MKRTTTLFLAACLLAGCAHNPGLDQERKHAAVQRWNQCAMEGTYKNAKSYDDAELCVDLALMDCRVQRMVYVSTLSPFLRSDIVKERTALAVEEKMRTDLTVRARKLILDFQREADKAPPVPLEIK